MRARVRHLAPIVSVPGQFLIRARDQIRRYEGNYIRTECVVCKAIVVLIIRALEDGGEPLSSGKVVWLSRPCGDQFSVGVYAAHYHEHRCDDVLHGRGSLSDCTSWRQIQLARIGCLSTGFRFAISVVAEVSCARIAEVRL